jgi:hypothetical protein
MRGPKVVMVLLAALAFVIAPAVARAASQADWGSGKSGTLDYRSIRGEVTAVDLHSKTLQVTATGGSATGPVSVALDDQTIVHQGILHREAADITVGEHVDITYDGAGGKWVADSINILESFVAVAPFLGNDMRSAHD